MGVRLRKRNIHGSLAHERRRESPACAHHKEAEDPAEDGRLGVLGYGRVGVHCATREDS